MHDQNVKWPVTQTGEQKRLQLYSFRTHHLENLFHEWKRFKCVLNLTYIDKEMVLSNSILSNGLKLLAITCFLCSARWKDIRYFLGKKFYCLVKTSSQHFFKTFSVPILDESWLMTESVRSQMQASKMRFLRRIEGATLLNKERNSEIRKSLNIKRLLLRTERSQLKWFGHVTRMPQESLSKQALLAKANGRRPVERLRTRWTNYIEETMNVMEDREV